MFICFGGRGIRPQQLDRAALASRVRGGPLLFTQVGLCSFPISSSHFRLRVGLCHAMPLVMKQAMKRKVSRVRLSPFLRGAVYGMHLADASLDTIAKAMRKPDGTKLSQQGVWHCIQLCDENGGVKWDGVVETGGRSRETTDKMDKALVDLVFKHRGSAIVTIPFLKKKLPEWRAVSHKTVERRLGDAGLARLDANANAHGTR